jgi:hypothetical protein
MSKKYGRQQLAQRTKPTDNPSSGFIELFADSSNSGKLTILYSNGITEVLAIESILIGGYVREDKDSNGIFITTKYKDVSGVVRKKSVLSGGTSPSYTTRTETYYDTDGTTELYQRVYTLNYSGSDFIGETLNA